MAIPSYLWNIPNLTADAINAMAYLQRGLGPHLGIKFVAVEAQSISATMPAAEHTYQPAGILHGGASVVLAETLGSVASNLIIDNEKYAAVGLEINANHLRPVKDDIVTGICTPIHIGAKTHVWDIKMYNSKQKLTCISRLTVAIIAKPV